ncbi:unnamed protein product [Chrysoparadoxa australica]
MGKRKAESTSTKKKKAKLETTFQLEQVDDSNALLVTPEAELAQHKELTGSADLMAHHSLEVFEQQLNAQTLPTNFGHFLHAKFEPMINARWTIMSTEKANFPEVLSFEPIETPLERLPLDQMRRAFRLYRKEGDEASTPARPARPCRMHGLKGLKDGEMTPAEVSEAAAPTFQAIWAMSWGKVWKNPFKLVITRENCVGLGIPNYFDFVNNPMNLTWVKEKLQQNEYPLVSAFAQDLELICRNAQAFNRPGDEVWGFAAELRAQYLAKLLEAGYDVSAVAQGS